MPVILQGDKRSEAIEYVVGNAKILENTISQPPKKPFDESCLDFLERWSKQILKHASAKQYPDVITFAFWIRKANLLHMKQEQNNKINLSHKIGRGVVFHVAPSNVPVNYAYSLVAGLLSGNANIVRIPSKDFAQLQLLNETLKQALEESKSEIANDIVLIRYGHQKEINDYLSALCDVRVIWGGDQTIGIFKESKTKPRTVDITFSDRFSFLVLDAQAYIKAEKKELIAKKFYNDTYLFDQNACTAPHLIIWVGEQKQKAQEIFWEKLEQEVREKYTYVSIKGIDKLVDTCLLSNCKEVEFKRILTSDNLLTRIKVNRLDPQLIQYKGKYGFFFEYDCDDMNDMREICNQSECQTITYFGCKEELFSFIKLGCKGIDRVVPIGQSMDFDLIWDGYSLIDSLSRTISFL